MGNLISNIRKETSSLPSQLKGVKYTIAQLQAYVEEHKPTIVFWSERDGLADKFAKATHTYGCLPHPDKLLEHLTTHKSVCLVVLVEAGTVSWRWYDEEYYPRLTQLLKTTVDISRFLVVVPTTERAQTVWANYEYIIDYLSTVPAWFPKNLIVWPPTKQ